MSWRYGWIVFVAAVMILNAMRTCTRDDTRDRRSSHRPAIERRPVGIGGQPADEPREPPAVGNLRDRSTFVEREPGGPSVGLRDFLAYQEHASHARSSTIPRERLVHYRHAIAACEAAFSSFDNHEVQRLVEETVALLSSEEGRSLPARTLRAESVEPGDRQPFRIENELRKRVYVAFSGPTRLARSVAPSASTSAGPAEPGRYRIFAWTAVTDDPVATIEVDLPSGAGVVVRP